MIYLRGFLIWLLIISAEAVHGISRELFLTPHVGDFRARQIAVFSGTIIIFIIAFFSVKWLRANRLSQLLAVGIIWVCCTIVFELYLGHVILGYSWDHLASDYNIVKGGLLPIGLLCMMLSPFAAAKSRKII
jgi:hypothetical protein